MNDTRQNRKPIPVVTGLSVFDEIIQGKAFYVDKTLFVQDVFHSGSAAMLILRPRRWGKSLNLSMLKYFLETPLREGTEKPGEIDLEKLEEKKNFFKEKRILREHPEVRRGFFHCMQTLKLKFQTYQNPFLFSPPFWHVFTSVRCFFLWMNTMRQSIRS